MTNRIRQAGFTLSELLIVIAAGGVLTVIGFVIYAAIHFVSKYW